MSHRQIIFFRKVFCISACSSLKMVISKISHLFQPKMMISSDGKVAAETIISKDITYKC